MKNLLRVGLLSVAAASCLLADVTYTQTVKFTGGTLVDLMRRIASNPMMSRAGGGAMRNAFQDQTSTVYVKGSKMAHVGDTVSTIFDLDAGTMTIINNEKHTYSVRTFDQMHEQMEQMQQRMNRGQTPPVDFDVKVDKTGQTRTIDGQTATETLLTLTAKSPNASGQMVVKVDAWLVPLDPAMRELVDFSKRLSEKFSYAFASPGMGAAGAGIGAAMRESMKLNGFAVLSQISVSGVSSPLMAMSGQAGNTDPNAPALDMETSSSNLSSGPVDDSKFAIPAGYTEEQPRQR